MIFRGSVWGVLGGVAPQNSVKIFASKISNDIKNTGIVNLVVQRFDSGGSISRGSPGAGTLKLCRNICLSVKYLLIFKKTGTLVWATQKIDFGGSIWGVSGGVVPPNYVKIFVSKISTADIKKHWHRKLSRSKTWFFVGPLWSLREVVPQTTSKYFSHKYLLISKNTGTACQVIQKIDVCVGHLEGSLGGWYPQTMSRYLSLYCLLISKM